VGKLNLLVRSRISDATVNTVLSFTVPFLASIPAELLDASGLVAAVVAGLVTGSGAPRVLPPQHRMSDAQNWRTVEVIVEGAIFLTMGLELAGIVADVEENHQGVGSAALIATGALLLTLAVRTAYVAQLILILRRRARRKAASKPHVESLHGRLSDPQTAGTLLQGTGRSLSPAHAERLRTRLRRTVADIDYFLAEPMGWREGTVLVWAGMRGAVTLAAAQTLPSDAPNRAVLVLIAFLVAGGSLLFQGATLPAVIRMVRPSKGDPDAVAQERIELMTLLHDVAAGVLGPDAVRLPARADGSSEDQDWRVGKVKIIAAITAQREALLDARDDGLYSSAALTAALANLDADQISLELKGAPEG
jgi:monovalent cation/hydrogen antiporter